MDKWIITASVWIFALFFVLGGVFLFCALVSLPFWLMWNWLIPDIFGLPEITWLQAFGLWTFIVVLRSTSGSYLQFPPFNGGKSNLEEKVKKISDTNSLSHYNMSWNSWIDQIKKKYEA